MTYAPRYTAHFTEFAGPASVRYRVDVLMGGYDGDPEPFALAQTPIKRQAGGRSKSELSGVRPARLTVSIHGSSERVLREVLTGRVPYRVRLTRNPGVDAVTEFEGVVADDRYESPLSPIRKGGRLRAACGLAALKDAQIAATPDDAEALIAAGPRPLAWWMLSALSATGLGLAVETIDEWYAAGMDDEVSPLLQAYVHPSRWMEVKTESRTVGGQDVERKSVKSASWLTVLNDICAARLAVLTQHAGRWRFAQRAAYLQQTATARVFAPNALEQQALSAADETITLWAHLPRPDHQRLSGGSTTARQAAGVAQVTYGHGKAESILPQPFLTGVPGGSDPNGWTFRTDIETQPYELPGGGSVQAVYPLIAEFGDGDVAAWGVPYVHYPPSVFAAIDDGHLDTDAPVLISPEVYVARSGVRARLRMVYTGRVRSTWQDLWQNAEPVVVEALVRFRLVTPSGTTYHLKRPLVVSESAPPSVSAWSVTAPNAAPPPGVRLPLALTGDMVSVDLPTPPLPEAGTLRVEIVSVVDVSRFFVDGGENHYAAASDLFVSEITGDLLKSDEDEPLEEEITQAGTQDDPRVDTYEYETALGSGPASSVEGALLSLSGAALLEWAGGEAPATGDGVSHQQAAHARRPVSAAMGTRRDRRDPAAHARPLVRLRIRRAWSRLPAGRGRRRSARLALPGDGGAGAAGRHGRAARSGRLRYRTGTGVSSPASCHAEPSRPLFRARRRPD